MPATLPAYQEEYIGRKIAEVEAEEELQTGTGLVHLAEVAPPSLDRSNDKPWPMVLEAAIRIAMRNSVVVRQDAQFCLRSTRFTLHPSKPPRRSTR